MADLSTFFNACPVRADSFTRVKIALSLTHVLYTWQSGHWGRFNKNTEL